MRIFEKINWLVKIRPRKLYTQNLILLRNLCAKIIYQLFTREREAAYPVVMSTMGKWCLLLLGIKLSLTHLVELELL